MLAAAAMRVSVDAEGAQKISGGVRPPVLL